MARYEYSCPTCEDRFEVERPMTSTESAVQCPAGHGGARRVFSPVASLGARGEGPVPAPVAAGGGCCGGACGCG